VYIDINKGATNAKGNDFAFRGRPKPRKIFAEQYGVEKKDVKSAMRALLQKMAEELEDMASARHGFRPHAKWEFTGNKFYFTNMRFEADEMPWEDDFVDGEVFEVADGDRTTVEWLGQLGLDRPAHFHFQGNEKSE